MDKFINTMTTGNAIQQDYDKQLNNFNNQLKELQNTINGFSMNIFNQFKPEAAMVIASTKGILDAFNSLITEIPILSPILKEFFGLTVLSIGAMTSLASAIFLASNVTRVMTPLLITFAGAMGLTTTTAAVAATATTAAIPAITTLTVSMVTLASGIAIAVAGLAALITTIKLVSDKVETPMKELEALALEFKKAQFDNSLLQETNKSLTEQLKTITLTGEAYKTSFKYASQYTDKIKSLSSMNKLNLEAQNITIITDKQIDEAQRQIDALTKRMEDAVNNGVDKLGKVGDWSQIKVKFLAGGINPFSKVWKEDFSEMVVSATAGLEEVQNKVQAEIARIQKYADNIDFYKGLTGKYSKQEIDDTFGLIQKYLKENNYEAIKNLALIKENKKEFDILLPLISDETVINKTVVELKNERLKLEGKITENMKFQLQQINDYVKMMRQASEGSYIETVLNSASKKAVTFGQLMREINNQLDKGGVSPEAKNQVLDLYKVISDSGALSKVSGEGMSAFFNSDEVKTYAASVIELNKIIAQLDENIFKLNKDTNFIKLKDAVGGTDVEFKALLENYAKYIEYRDTTARYKPYNKTQVDELKAIADAAGLTDEQQLFIIANQVKVNEGLGTTKKLQEKTVQVAKDDLAVQKEITLELSNYISKFENLSKIRIDLSSVFSNQDELLQIDTKKINEQLNTVAKEYELFQNKIAPLQSPKQLKETAFKGINWEDTKETKNYLDMLSEIPKSTQQSLDLKTLVDKIEQNNLDKTTKQVKVSEAENVILKYTKELLDESLTLDENGLKVKIDSAEQTKKEMEYQYQLIEARQNYNSIGLSGLLKEQLELNNINDLYKSKQTLGLPISNLEKLKIESDVLNIQIKIAETLNGIKQKSIDLDNERNMLNLSDLKTSEMELELSKQRQKNLSTDHYIADDNLTRVIGKEYLVSDAEKYLLLTQEISTLSDNEKQTVQDKIKLGYVVISQEEYNVKLKDANLKVTKDTNVVTEKSVKLQNELNLLNLQYKNIGNEGLAKQRSDYQELLLKQQQEYNDLMSKEHTNKEMSVLLNKQDIESKNALLSISKTEYDLKVELQSIQRESIGLNLNLEGIYKAQFDYISLILSSDIERTKIMNSGLSNEEKINAIEKLKLNQSKAQVDIDKLRLDILKQQLSTLLDTVENVLTMKPLTFTVDKQGLANNLAKLGNTISNSTSTNPQQREQAQKNLLDTGVQSVQYGIDLFNKVNANILQKQTEAINRELNLLEMRKAIITTEAEGRAINEQILAKKKQLIDTEQQTKTQESVLSGVGAGAQIGAQVGGVPGAIAGGVIGGLFNGLMSMFNDDSAKQKELLDEQVKQTKLLEELNKSIEASNKYLEVASKVGYKSAEQSYLRQLGYSSQAELQAQKKPIDQQALNEAANKAGVAPTIVANTGSMAGGLPNGRTSGKNSLGEGGGGADTIEKRKAQEEYNKLLKEANEQLERNKVIQQQIDNLLALRLKSTEALLGFEVKTATSQDVADKKKDMYGNAVKVGEAYKDSFKLIENINDEIMSGLGNVSNMLANILGNAFKNILVTNDAILNTLTTKLEKDMTVLAGELSKIDITGNIADQLNKIDLTEVINDFNEIEKRGKALGLIITQLIPSLVSKGIKLSDAMDLTQTTKDLKDAIVSGISSGDITSAWDSMGKYLQSTINKSLVEGFINNSTVGLFIQDLIKEIGKGNFSENGITTLIESARTLVTSGSYKSALKAIQEVNDLIYPSSMETLIDRAGKQAEVYANIIKKAGAGLDVSKELYSWFESIQGINEEFAKQNNLIEKNKKASSEFMNLWSHNWIKGTYEQISKFLTDTQKSLFESLSTNLLSGDFNKLGTDIGNIISDKIKEKLLNDSTIFAPFVKTIDDLLAGGNYATATNIVKILQDADFSNWDSLKELGFTDEQIKKIKEANALFKLINPTQYLDYQTKAQDNVNKSLNTYRMIVSGKAKAEKLDMSITQENNKKQLKQLESILAQQKEMKTVDTSYTEQKIAEKKKEIEITEKLIGSYTDQAQAIAELNDAWAKQREEERNSALVQGKLLTDWSNGVLKGTWEQVKGLVSAVAVGMHDAMVTALSANTFKDAATGIGSYVGTTIVDEMIKKLMDDKFKQSFVTLTKQLENLISDFSMSGLASIIGAVQKFAVETEAARIKLMAIRDALDFSASIDYSPTNTEIRYATTSTKENIYNTNVSVTVQAGTIVASNQDMTKLAETLAPFIVSGLGKIGVVIK